MLFHTHCLHMQLDASADGYVRAEAAGMIALTDPSVAGEHGALPVLGLISSTAVNQVCVHVCTRNCG